MTACTVLFTSSCALDWGATGGMLSGVAAALGFPTIIFQLFLSLQGSRAQTRAVQAQAEASESQAKAAKMQAKSRLLDLSNPINNLIFQNPDVYNFTYIGDDNSVPERNSVQWKRLMALCEMQANYIEFVIPSMKLLDNDERTAWEAFIRDTMNRPMFLEFWEIRKPWYDPEMRTYVVRSPVVSDEKSDQSPGK